MQNEVDRIEIIFENCDYITIPRKYIGRFSLYNIQRDISRVACNSISDEFYAETFLLEIHKDYKNETYHPFEDENETKCPYDRLLEFSDISGINVIWYDGHTESIDVVWNFDNEYSNSYQDIYEAKTGNLYIVVSKEDTVDSIFNKDEIDLHDEMKFITCVES